MLTTAFQRAEVRGKNAYHPLDKKADHLPGIAPSIGGRPWMFHIALLDETTAATTVAMMLLPISQAHTV
jgi:hypothetical protein